MSEITINGEKYASIEDYLEGKVDYKESLVSNFLNFLVSNKIIEDENNIDEKTQEMILDMVKKEIKNIKGGK